MERSESDNYSYMLVDAIVDVLGEDAQAPNILDIACSFERISELEVASGNAFLSHVVRKGKGFYEAHVDLTTLHAAIGNPVRQNMSEKSGGDKVSNDENPFAQADMTESKDVMDSLLEGNFDTQEWHNRAANMKNGESKQSTSFLGIIGSLLTGLFVSALSSLVFRFLLLDKGGLLEQMNWTWLPDVMAMFVGVLVAVGASQVFTKSRAG